MNIELIHNVYFAGIGGIGMSALARYFKAIGKNVAGYDRTETVLTKELVSEGMNVHYTDDNKLIPQSFRNASDTLIVYTPALPPDHKELGWFKSNGFEILKRAEVLGLISRSKEVLGIAGTHGKTTTSTMVAHLLRNSDLDCSAFLGGISLNFSNNLLLSEKSNLVVVEADEYDRSFLQLTPKATIVTSMDADHLDIYGTYEEYCKAFQQYISQIQPGGFCIIKKGLAIRSIQKDIRCYSYSIQDQADFFASNIHIVDGYYQFDINTPDSKIDGIQLGFPGLLNVENAVAAIAMAHLLGVQPNSIRKAMASFRGVKRRFEYHIKTEKLVFIDDYGHHPEELRCTIESVKQMFPGKKVTGIFQPHLFSRTNDLATEFAQSLSLLDKLILLEIYPARELPIPGVTSEILLEKVTIDDKQVCTKKNLLTCISAMEKPEVLITMGAGDIDTYVSSIKDILLKK